MEASPIRYAPSPGGKIAYRTIGDGPIDLTIYPTGAWNIDLALDDVRVDRWLRQLASFSRVILWNTRGAAMSDPLPLEISIEDWSQDLFYVLDAAESEHTSFVWYRDVAPIGLLAAASRPDRTKAIVLVDGYARQTRAPDYPYGLTMEEMRAFNTELVDRWGDGSASQRIAPELRDEPRLLDWFARLERHTASPAVFAKVRRTLEQVDVRGVLPSIQAAVLVIAHVGDPFRGVDQSQYLAEHLPMATYVERPGHCGIPWLHDVEGTNAEIRAFLAGQAVSAEIDDRYLATVMFTDIVDSTSRAAAMGDSAWRRLLDEHDSALTQIVEAFRGRRIKSTGDGLLATFDGPARAIRCGAAVRRAASRLGLQVRIGLHTGEVEDRGDDIGGIAVAIAARVMAEAGADDVLVSSAVPPLVAGSGLEFADRGVRTLKGVPGDWSVLAVTD